MPDEGAGEFDEAGAVGDGEEREARDQGALTDSVGSFRGGVLLHDRTRRLPAVFQIQARRRVESVTAAS